MGPCATFHEPSEARLTWALGVSMAGYVEQIAGDLAAAERYLREACEALRAMDEQGYLASVAGWLASVLYAQGRLDDARQMTEEAQAAAMPEDIDAQVHWRLTRARLLARSGQFPTARRIADEAEALIRPTSWAMLKVQVLLARAEVDRLAGAGDQAGITLRAALRICEDQRAMSVAGKVRGALASLTGRPGSKPA